jgi:hypothetical protein
MEALEKAMSNLFQVLQKVDKESSGVLAANFVSETQMIFREPAPAAPARTALSNRVQPRETRNPNRILAAAIDASMVIIALGLFLGVFVLGAGAQALTRHNAPLLALVLAVLPVFYWFLWVLTASPTPGTRFAKRCTTPPGGGS